MAPDVGQRFLHNTNHLDTGRSGPHGRKPLIHDQFELAPFADLAVQFDDRLHGADQWPLPDALQPQVVDGVTQASDRPLERFYLVLGLSGAVHTLRHPPEYLHRLQGVCEVLKDHVVQFAGYPAALGLNRYIEVGGSTAYLHRNLHHLRSALSSSSFMWADGPLCLLD